MLSLEAWPHLEAEKPGLGLVSFGLGKYGLEPQGLSRPECDVNFDKIIAVKVNFLQL